MTPNDDPVVLAIVFGLLTLLACLAVVLVWSL